MIEITVGKTYSPFRQLLPIGLNNKVLRGEAICPAADAGIAYRAAPYRMRLKRRRPHNMTI